MGMGAYDEDEHERRAEKTRVEADAAGARVDFRGDVEFEDGADADTLIEQFQQLRED
jgi:hypothetical protein